MLETTQSGGAPPSLTNFSFNIIANYDDNSVLDDIDFGDIDFPSMFYPYKNLPDISLKDFILSVCWLTGTFCTRNDSTPTNHILFRSIDLLYLRMSSL
ncbi:MAG: hypothetical protein FWD66_06140 [Paludibacter sp.]|nr:hypothetical protein [Paludibacter sp.]